MLFQYKTHLSLRKLSRIIDIFRQLKKNQTHFRWNIDISQTNFEKYSSLFSGGILTFHRQIFRKNQTYFQKKMKFLRHILISSQKHFQENIVPSKICLNLSYFFQICLETSSRKHRKKYLGLLTLLFWWNFHTSSGIMRWYQKPLLLFQRPIKSSNYTFLEFKFLKSRKSYLRTDFHHFSFKLAECLFQEQEFKMWSIGYAEMYLSICVCAFLEFWFYDIKRITTWPALQTYMS